MGWAPAYLIVTFVLSSPHHWILLLSFVFGGGDLFGKPWIQECICKDVLDCISL